MEPVERQREEEAPRRREAARSRGGSAEREQSAAGDGRTSIGSSSLSASSATSTSADSARDHDEEIRRRAYEIYEARGGAPGSDVDDWCAAEREVRASRGQRAD
jgi:hypothetical protein